MNPFDLIIIFLFITLFLYSFKGLIQEACATAGIVLGYVFSSQTYFHYSTTLNPLSLSNRSEEVLSFCFVFLLFSSMGVLSGFLISKVLGTRNPSTSTRVMGALLATPIKTTFFILTIIFLISKWFRSLKIGWDTSFFLPAIKIIEETILSIF